MCGPLRPIGDDAGPGEVGSGKPGDPPGSPLDYCGRGEGWGRGGRSRIFLSHWVTYDLPSRFTHPQELARNTVNERERETFNTAKIESTDSQHGLFFYTPFYLDSSIPRAWI